MERRDFVAAIPLLAISAGAIVGKKLEEGGISERLKSATDKIIEVPKEMLGAILWYDSKEDKWIEITQYETLLKRSRELNETLLFQDANLNESDAMDGSIRVKKNLY